MIRRMVERVRKGPRYRYRSAKTGLFVPRWFALLNPNTTIKEKVR